MKLIRSCTPRLHLTEVGNLPAERFELPTSGLQIFERFFAHS
jgi:hypothetical protein